MLTPRCLVVEIEAVRQGAVGKGSLVGGDTTAEGQDGRLRFPGAVDHEVNDRARRRLQLAGRQNHPDRVEDALLGRLFGLDRKVVELDGRRESAEVLDEILFGRAGRRHLGASCLGA